MRGPASGSARLNATTVLICHHDEPLNRFGLARWLASFTDLAAVVVIREPGARMRRRVKREIERIGWWRFLDVVAFRLYHRLFLAGADAAAEQDLRESLERRYPELPRSTRILETDSPNSKEAENLLHETKPQVVIARCKTILAQRIFGLAEVGTFVMHPGICPEYRNAHGCFWALASRDLKNVGMTLLKIDAGVDTGPVYGYFRYAYDERRESHSMIQDRVVFENLDAIEAAFREIAAGTRATISTAGRRSRAWGQPWLSAYWRWKRAAQRGAAG
jgi:folate-dependent phosphoribosylglycinamide formyltransferase PurN